MATLVKKPERNEPEKPIAMSASGANTGAVARRPKSAAAKVGRNAPCPCGSGKKYKECCGKNS